jgi:energy-coupling factor transporter ATP-binding protein EcfA2/energy-coupling factor transporter transmembrane protein EcfT
MDQSITLIIGRSGSGKSTFIQAIAGLINISSGSVTYGDTSLWNKKKVNKDVLLQHALAFQSPEQQLFAETIQEEFDYSLRPYRLLPIEGARRTSFALQELQLSQSLLQHSPFELSGGQKRSVAVATLIATDSPWMLLDEPSAGLDAKAAARLREQLKLWKQTKGIFMATHDWEYFLPIADRVLLIAEGRLLTDVSPAELMANPDLLHRAGIGVPNSFKVSSELQKVGVPTPNQLLSPEQMAREIIAQWEGTKEPVLPERSMDDINSFKPMASKAVEEPATPKPRLYRIDARLKWLMYMVVSVLILLQHQWLGLTIASVVAFSSLFLLKNTHAIQAIRLCKPLLYFTIIAALFAGIGISFRDGFGVDFDVSDCIFTIQRMLPFLMVTLISFVFTLSTSTLEMQLGLEKSLSIFERFRVPTAMLALTASLVLRFIPMIVWEAERFSLIAAARGKRAVRKGQIRIRDLRVFAIPLLISLFQMVEDLIVAIEIKGFKNKHKKEVS